MFVLQTESKSAYIYPNNNMSK